MLLVCNCIIHSAPKKSTLYTLRSAPGERNSEFSFSNYNHHIVIVVVAIRRLGNNVRVVCALRGGLHNAAMTGI